MKRITRYAGMVCFGVVLFVVSGIALAAEPERITVVFAEGGYPPFYMENLQEGMVIDLYKAFDQQTPEFELLFQGFPRKRVDLVMERGEAQISGLTNPMFVGEQAKNFLFTDAIWKSGNYIITNKSSGVTYQKVEDLFGKTLGVMFGNRNGMLDQYIEAGKITKSELRDYTALCVALQKKRVDAIVGNNHVTLYEMKQLGIDDSQFVFAAPPLFEYDLMPQIQKTHPHLVEKLNAFIAASKQNGLIEQITQKYLQ